MFMLRLLVVTPLLAVQFLAAKDTVIHITKENFAEVLKTDKPVIIDVSTTWCGPCKQLKPIFQQFAIKNEDRYQCAEIIGDETPELVQELGVMAYPTVLVYQNQKLVGSHCGYIPQEAFVSKIETIIASSGKELKELSQEALATKFLDAIQKGKADEVAALIKAGVDLNKPFADGFPPLLWACIAVKTSHDKGLDILRLLLDNGASTENLSIGEYPVGSLRNYIEGDLANARAIVDVDTKILEMLNNKAQ